MTLKKITTVAACIIGVSAAFGQIRQPNINDAVATNSSAFIDASSSTSYNNSANMGKGLLFPRVDLRNFTAFGQAPFGVANNYPTYYDGMIVYNTATSGVAGAGFTQGTLNPGFWYYENKSGTINGGTWKPLGAAGVSYSYSYDADRHVLTITGSDGSIQNVSITEVDGVIGNEVTGAANETLVRSGSGTAASPYQLARAAISGDVTIAAGSNSATVTGIQGKAVNGTPSTTNNILVYDGTNLTYSNINSALVKKDITTATASATATAPLTIANGTGQIVGANNATLTVNNTAPLWNANQIQSTPVSATAPANQQVLVYDGAKYTPASAWLTTGNAGTTAGTNFIGTTDNQDIVFKRNGVQIGWLQSKFTEFNFEVGNISFGAGALQMGATGNANIAIGCSALEHATNCNSNIALGNRALNKVTNRQGGDNIAIGSDAGVSLIQGAGNIFIGMSTGGSLQTGSSNIVIGSSMQASSNSVSNEITIGTVYSNSATPNTARVFSNGWNYLSDRRFKHDIKPINQGLDFVSKLKPVEFVYNNRTEKMLGFIAQDVQEVMNQENMAGYDLVTTMFDDFIGLNTTEIIPILTKAIQEQQAQINDLKAQIEELQNR